jgi:hypothetical protein
MLPSARVDSHSGVTNSSCACRAHPILLSFFVVASKKDLQKSLESHPDLIKIEGHVRDLEEELKQLGDR